MAELSGLKPYIHERDTYQLEYDTSRNKLKSVQEKESKDPAKYQPKMQKVKLN